MSARSDLSKTSSNASAVNQTTNKSVADSYNKSSTTFADSNNTTSQKNSGNTKTVGSNNATDNRTIVKIMGNVTGALPGGIDSAIGTGGTNARGITSDLADMYKAAITTEGDALSGGSVKWIAIAGGFALLIIALMFIFGKKG